jgi:hypothetical protein
MQDVKKKMNGCSFMDGGEEIWGSGVGGNSGGTGSLMEIKNKIR